MTTRDAVMYNDVGTGAPVYMYVRSFGPGRVSRRFTERTNEMTRALSEIATAILPVPIANLSAVNKGLQIAISKTFSNEAYFRVLLDEHF